MINQNSVDYKIMDVVPDYNPDIVGDIHNMPFADNSRLKPLSAWRFLNTLKTLLRRPRNFTVFLNRADIVLSKPRFCIITIRKRLL